MASRTCTLLVSPCFVLTPEGDHKRCLLMFSAVQCIHGFVDSSTNPQCQSFLLHARDNLGVNVIFSSANLNQLEEIMTRIGNDLSGSSDYIIKMDADEYLAVYDDDSNTLKPSLANQYLSQLMKNVSKPDDEQACVRFVQSSIPTKDLCGNDINTPLIYFLFTVQSHNHILRPSMTQDTFTSTGSTWEGTRSSLAMTV